MKNVLQVTILTLLLGLILTACAPAVPVPGVASSPSASPTQTTTRPAPVESVEVQISQSDPSRVSALVRGHLTESCATLGASGVTYASNVFQIAIVSVSPSDRGCVQMVTPFETTIALDARDLPAGNYTVIANGASAVFTLPSEAAAPTAAPTAVPTTAPPASACTDAAAFVSDVTIPDNTLMSPGVPFTKTWKLKNAGTCTWDSSYLVSYLSGTTMTQQPGYWIVQPGQTVTPGHTVNISVGMTAPVDDGRYASYWGLRPEHGQFMPIQGGANGNSFYVKIEVNKGGAGAAGRITAASIDIGLEQGSGSVCTAQATYFVHAYITADGPTTASYEIDSSAGQIPAGNFQVGSSTALSPVDYGNVAFDQADTKTISLRFVGPYPHPDDITLMLRVNGGDWISTKLSCQ